MINFTKFKNIYENIYNSLKETMRDKLRTDIDWSVDARLLDIECEKGSIEGFNKYFYTSNPLIDYNTCVLKAIAAPQSDLALHLLKQDNFVSKLNQFDAFLIKACVCDKIEIVKYLFEHFNDKLDMYAGYDKKNELFKSMVKQRDKPYKVLAYIMYDKNYNADRELQEWLIEHKHEDILNTLKNRDLYNDLSHELPTQTPVVRKNRKI